MNNCIFLGEFEGYQLYANSLYFHAIKDNQHYTVIHKQDCYPGFAKVVEECQKRYQALRKSS